MKRTLYNLDKARSTEQLERMKRLEEEGVCNFCPDYSGEDSLGTPILESEFCRAYRNMSPYENSGYSFIIVFNRCINQRSDLNKQEWLSLLEVCNALESRFDILGSTLVMRSGDWRYTAGSVSHLHAHLIVGSGDPDKKTRVRVG